MEGIFYVREVESYCWFFCVLFRFFILGFVFLM